MFPFLLPVSLKTVLIHHANETSGVRIMYFMYICIFIISLPLHHGPTNNIFLAHHAHCSVPDTVWLWSCGPLCSVWYQDNVDDWDQQMAPQYSQSWLVLQISVSCLTAAWLPVKFSDRGRDWLGDYRWDVVKLETIVAFIRVGILEMFKYNFSLIKLVTRHKKYISLIFCIAIR